MLHTQQAYKEDSSNCHSVTTDSARRWARNSESSFLSSNLAKVKVADFTLLMESLRLVQAWSSGLALSELARSGARIQTQLYLTAKSFPACQTVPGTESQKSQAPVLT